MIIKNCPAITKSTVCVDDKYSNLCQDCTDCVMKRIVEECKSESEPQYLYERDKITDEPIAVFGVKYNQGAKLAKKILEMLEIEECE